MVKPRQADDRFRNQLLSQFSPQSIEELALQSVDLPIGMTLYEPSQLIDHVYFPESGAVSVVSTMEDGHTIEVGTIGREGMAGSMLLMDSRNVPFRYFVQVAGAGYRIGAKRFKETIDSRPELRNLVLRFEVAFRTQVMQGMACNGLHSIQQRCCRWLLMTRDRVDSDDLKLSHEFLGFMLGVRRASVTDVLGPLQAAGMVSSNRGTITILDRKALEEKVCECYWVMSPRELIG